MRSASRLFLPFVLSLVLGVQGLFAGAVLCREAEGGVSLEWGSGGRCETPAGSSVACLKDGARDGAGAAEHCLLCLDVPLPSDTPAKSAISILPAPVAPVFATLPEAALTPVASASGLVPCSASPFDGARTVRLLI